MIASPIHKFVILTPPRTGTKSLRDSVGKVGRYAHVELGGHRSMVHFTYAAYRDMFGDYFDRNGCDTFIIVREPLDVLRSWYRLRKSTGRYDKYFQDFMDDWAQQAPTRRARVSCGIDFCLDARGNIPDEVIFIRYTELSKIAYYISRKVDKQVELPHLNPSPEIDPNLMTLEDEHKYEKLNEARHVYNRIPFV
ncbi:MAG: hypothetical protein GDA53_11805 [Rhodobacteraceae bacterium]|nr:hypothetical protein [Paracoccaceae bacterium]